MNSNGTRIEVGPTVAVSSAGVGLAWCDGQFHGPKEALDDLTYAITTGWPVTVLGADLIPSADTPLGALAALFSRRPGRTVITEAPDDVLDTVLRAGYLHTFITGPDSEKA